MPLRPRIQWRVLDGTDETVVWTQGWLPESPTLRWSLANSLRIEGLCENWHESFAAAEAAVFSEGWVAEDDFGDTVQVDAECKTTDGVWLSGAQSATFARLADV